MVRQLFFVSVKAPTAAVLDTNNEAQIIVSGRRNCRNPPYFVPFNGSRTASADGRKDGSRMSLHDWLASNVIPDSNALNKAYLRSMKRRKRGPQFTCDSGWTLYNSRCYRYYPGQNRTWLEARGHYEGEHGYLASVADAGVDGWLKAVLNPRPPVWIGLHKPVLNGAWAWHSMEQTNYTNWDVGFPRRLRAGREVHNRRGRMGRHRRRLFRRHSHASLQQPLPRPHFHTTWQSSSTYSGRLRRSISDQPQ
uniref:C-type lectin domain-containing protein n=1 Tax=Mesocestoides corti TaxID=53468 RepID=A0A5K3G2P5_MESCO